MRGPEGEAERGDAPADRGREEPTELGPLPAIARTALGKVVLAAVVFVVMVALIVGADGVALRVAVAVVLLPVLVYLTVTSNRDRRREEQRRRYFEGHGRWPSDDSP